MPAKEPDHIFYFQSPIGWLLMDISDGVIHELDFCEAEPVSSLVPSHAAPGDYKVYEQCCCQLQEYFQGKRYNFQLNMQQEGTPFRTQVWNELLKIPYGKTISYLQLAQRIGNPKSVRAVGNANGNNNLAIIVPCHRVIGSNGSLTGYAGGLWRKKWLLDLENKNAHGLQFLF